MKRNVRVLVFICEIIKKYFFISTNSRLKKGENIKLEVKNEQNCFADEYHKAFSGVTRWQTL